MRQNTNFGDTYTFNKPLYNPDRDTDRRIERSVSSSSSAGKHDSKWQTSGRKALSGTRDSSSVRATSFSRMSRVPQPSLFDGKSSNGTGGGGGGGGGGGSSQSHQTKPKTHNSASRRLFAALEYSDHSSDEGGGGRKSSTDHHEQQESYSSSHQERKYVIGGLVGSHSATESSTNNHNKGRSSISSTSNKDKLDMKHKAGRGFGGGRDMFVINEGSIDGFSGNGYSNAIASGGSKEGLNRSNSPSVIDSGEAFVPGDEENYSSYPRDKLTSGIAVYKEQITNGNKK